MMPFPRLLHVFFLGCLMVASLRGQDNPRQASTQKRTIIQAKVTGAFHEKDRPESISPHTKVVLPEGFSVDEFHIRPMPRNVFHVFPKFTLPIIHFPRSMTAMDCNVVIKGKWDRVPESGKRRRASAVMMIDVYESISFRQLSNRMKKLGLPMRGGSYDKVAELIQKMQNRSRKRPMESYCLSIEFELPKVVNNECIVHATVDFPATEKERKQARVYEFRIRDEGHQKFVTSTPGYGGTGSDPTYVKTLNSWSSWHVSVIDWDCMTGRPVFGWWNRLIYGRTSKKGLASKKTGFLQTFDIDAKKRGLDSVPV